MTVESLVERTRPFLSEAEVAALERPEEAASAPGEVGSVAKRWLDGERQLRNAIARRRAPLWGASPDAYLREHEGFRVPIEAGVARAFEAADPLQREHALDSVRWRLLDDLAGVVPWGFAALFAYAERLRIARAWVGREPEEGRLRLQAILDRLEEQHA